MFVAWAIPAGAVLGGPHLAYPLIKDDGAPETARDRAVPFRMLTFVECDFCWCAHRILSVLHTSARTRGRTEISPPADPRVYLTRSDTVLVGLVLERTF
jgi:hypothetical protein